MIIRDCMKMLLRIERPPQEKSKITIRGHDDICNLVYGLTPIKGILIGEPVFDDVGEYDACSEGFGDARKKGGVDNGRAERIRGRRRWLPLLRKRSTNT